MLVSVIGAGYVGLVSGACLAEKGHSVILVDHDRNKVDAINRSSSPIHEEGLDRLLKTNSGRRLWATTDLARAIHETEISLISVGTPTNENRIDLGQLREISVAIGHALRDKTAYHVIIVKSTVVPGTTDDLVIPLIEGASGKKAGVDFGIGVNPEFLREGVAVLDFMYPDRIIAGAIDEATHSSMHVLYEPFFPVTFFKTNNKTAEMIKYASNALLATLISFSNEIGNLGSLIGDIDAVDVMHGILLDKRISPFAEDGKRISPGIVSYLEVGCGFGGSCLPKDVRALIAHGENFNNPMRLLRAVNAINSEQPNEIISRLLKHYPSLQDVKIAVLGLAFKAGTDDMRESPAIPIVNRLVREGASIIAFDPASVSRARKVFAGMGILYESSLEKAICEAEVVIVLTKCPEFLELPKALLKMGKEPLVIDGRRMLQKETIARYEGIGV